MTTLEKISLVCEVYFWISIHFIPPVIFGWVVYTALEEKSG